MSEPTSSAPEESASPTGQDDWLNDADVETPEQDDPEAGEKPADEIKPEDGEDEQQPGADEKDPEKPDEADPEKPAEGDDPDAAKKTEEAEAEQKRFNDEQAKLRIQAREAVRNAARQHAENAQAAIDDAGDDEVKRELAELKAKDAQREADDFVRSVEHNQSVMSNDYSRVAREIGMFRPTNEDGSPNPEYNDRAYNLALEHLAPHLMTQEMTDDSGNSQLVILGSNVPVYDFLKTEAEAMKAIMGDVAEKSAIEGRQAEQKMRGRADPSNGTTTPKTRETSADDKEAREMKDAFADV